MQENKNFKDPQFRCKKCHKLLGKSGHENEIEIKCRRCGTFNHFLEKTKEQIVITDRDGKILFVNNAAMKEKRFSSSDIIGETPSIWGGIMPDSFYKKMWDTIKNKKKTFVSNITNKRKNGETYNSRIRISPVFDVKGEIKFYVGIEVPFTK